MVNFKKNFYKKAVKLLFTLAVCIIAGFLINPYKSKAATKKTKVVLEFTDGTKMTWKQGGDKLDIQGKKLAYIYFGSYPQKEVTGKELTKEIKNAKYDNNGVATVGGVKYKRISSADAKRIGDREEYYQWENKEYAYFKYEPIKWRVLTSTKKQAFLLTEYGVDTQIYGPLNKSDTWAESSLREWLNNEFVSVAFSKTEGSLIKKTKVVTAGHPVYGNDGGATVNDKIFILEFKDLVNKKYGFKTDYDSSDIMRRCSATQYAHAMGLYFSNGWLDRNGKGATGWWLRSQGRGGPGYVMNSGCINDLGVVNNAVLMVRPAMKLNLTKIIK